MRTRTHRQRPVLVVLLTAMMVLGLMAGPALSDHGSGAFDPKAGAETTTHHIFPEFIPDNPNCEEGQNELRVNNPGTATYSLGDFSVTVTLYNAGGGNFAFDFTTSGGAIEDMYVKGGPNANYYEWASPVTSDTFLHAPINPNNGKFYGVSHVSFCFVEVAQLKVTKFIDANEDGLNNDGAPNAADLAGWIFDVYDEGGNLVGTITTDETGMGTLEVAPGTYSVVERNAGDPLTSNGATTIVTTDNPQEVAVVAGTTEELEFGNTCVISKHFEVSGVPAGVSTVDVDYSGTHTDSVALADQGGGTWTGTAPDTFRIGDTLSWSVSVDGGAAQSGGSETFVLADGYPDCERTNTLQLDPPDIEVFKFKDADGDGDPADADASLSGWMIELQQGGTTLDSKTTDANGRVVFADLAPGTYQVCEVQQANWEQTYPVDCHEVTVDFGSDGSQRFLNSPLSEIRVGFTDLTGFTNAAISCTDADGNVIASLSYDSMGTLGADSVDNSATISLSQLVGPDGEIGTADDGIDCTFRIVDP